eukprot:gene10567-12222_t
MATLTHSAFARRFCSALFFAPLVSVRLPIKTPNNSPPLTPRDYWITGRVDDVTTAYAETSTLTSRRSHHIHMFASGPLTMETAQVGLRGTTSGAPKLVRPYHIGLRSFLFSRLVLFDTGGEPTAITCGVGDYWITGRVDDVINVSGHRIGTAEVEGVLTDHEQVQAPALPKTRSGKLMRRVLKKIAMGENDFGDVSTLADPSVIELLQQLRRPNTHTPSEGALAGGLTHRIDDTPRTTPQVPTQEGVQETFSKSLFSDWPTSKLPWVSINNLQAPSSRGSAPTAGSNNLDPTTWIQQPPSSRGSAPTAGSSSCQHIVPKGINPGSDGTRAKRPRLLSPTPADRRS